MPYFSEVNEYKTYAGQDEDFHFSYNVNSGGGQSFLGGKFKDENGNVESASVLNGRMGVFQFRVMGADGVLRSVSLEDDETKYEIKPRAVGDNNMKLGVEDKKTPSVAISAFLMLPKPCGVKRADHVDISPLCSKNYWLQSMWMSVDKTSSQIATLIPKDCVFSGGVDRNGGGQLRHFKVDFAKRMLDIVAVAKSSKLDREILDCVCWFADVYEGRRNFICDDAISAIEDVMKYLQQKYPDRYSGLMDPLPVIVELAQVSMTQKYLNDPLTIALQLFKAQRLTWTNKFSKGEPVYKNINLDVREFFGDSKNWNSAGLKTDANKFKDFCIHHTWMLSNGNAWPSISHYTDVDRAAFVDWVDEHVVKNVKPLVETVCTDSGFKGVTNKAVTELLMKFHPDQYCLCNTPTLEALRTLGLLAIDVPDQYGFHEYQHVMGLCAQLRQRLEDAEIFRVDGESDAPDYVTVNEFLYFVSEKKDLIIQEWSKHMKHEIKLENQVKSEDFKFKNFVDAFYEATKKANLKYDHNLVRRFVCALLAKPFVVLTGLSGSGKTKLADAFTQWIGTDDMVKVVPVGADWTNNEKMLGYPNALDGTKYVLSDTGILKFLLDARDNPTVPFFLVLDEMNLSHVERYFADFLSAMESGKKIHLYDGDARTSNDGTPIPSELEIPKNLFVIGTMNVDETTYMFSPKVLDRAQVVEFRVSPDEMKAFLAAPTYPKMGALKGKGLIYAQVFLELSQKRGEKEIDDKDANAELQTILNTVFPELAKLGSEFAYRCAIEVVTFVAYYLDASGYYGETDKDKKKTSCIAAIDAAMLQKLLPKLHGSLNRLGPAIDVMLEKFSKTEDDGSGGEKVTPIYPLSHDKLLRMKDRLEANGFTSYAEA